MSRTVAGAADDPPKAAEEEQRRVTALREEWEDAEQLAVLGLATRELLHDVANRLNQIMLQASILMMRLPQGSAADVKVIREEGLKAAERLAPLQQRGRLHRKQKTALDLNRALQDLVTDDASFRDRVRLKLASEPVPLLARPGDLKRLLRLFFRGLFAERSAGDPLEVGTAALPKGRAAMHVRDAARSLPAAAADRPFDSEDGLFAAADPIDCMALQVLLRDTGGTLHMDNAPGGGIEVRIEWSQDSSEREA